VFSVRLRECRKAKGITQRELADMLDVTEGAYRAYETDRASPSPAALKLLAERLGVSISYLFEETDDPTPHEGDGNLRWAAQLNIPEEEATPELKESLEEIARSMIRKARAERAKREQGENQRGI